MSLLNYFCCYSCNVEPHIILFSYEGATNKDAPNGQYIETGTEEEEKGENKSRTKSRSEEKKDRMVSSYHLLILAVTRAKVVILPTFAQQPAIGNHSLIGTLPLVSDLFLPIIFR